MSVRIFWNTSKETIRVCYHSRPRARQGSRQLGCRLETNVQKPAQHLSVALGRLQPSLPHGLLTWAVEIIVPALPSPCSVVRMQGDGEVQARVTNTGCSQLP